MPWRELFKVRRKREEIDEELACHVQLATADRIARGEAPREARRRALRELGGVRLAREDTRAVWTWTWLEQCQTDLRDGARVLTRSPGVSLSAIALIALVIGGNTTVYAIAHSLLAKPAPGVNAERLVMMLLTSPPAARSGPGIEPDRALYSYQEYLQFETQITTLAPVLAFQSERFTLVHDTTSSALVGALVSDRYFDALGVAMVKGRTFNGDESLARGSELTVILADRIWKEQFQGADDIVGRSVFLNGYSATVVGVAPPHFRGPLLAAPADLWVPLVAYSLASGAERALRDGVGRPTVLMGRLIAGVSLAKAQTELDTIFLRSSAPDGAIDRDRRIVLVPYSMTAPAGSGGESLVTRAGARILSLFSIVTALTLIIVCANVANLMLGRALVRQPELALRQSLGAPRTRIVRMLLAEGLVISVGACAAAFALAWWLSKTLAHVLPLGPAVALNFTPDVQVLEYAVTLGLIATVLFMMAPALLTWRQDLLAWVRPGEHAVVQGRSKVSRILVAVQLGFSVVLLTSAGLAYRSLSLTDRLDVGFETRHLLLVTIDTFGTATDANTHLRLADTVRQRLRAVPGVRSVAFANRPPQDFWPVDAVGEQGSAARVRAERNDVGPGYLAALGLSPLHGEEFKEQMPTEGDGLALINQNLAELLFGGDAAIGRMLSVGAQQRPFRVVGVAPNAFYSGFRPDSRPKFIFVHPHAPTPGQVTFYVRGSGVLESMTAPIRLAIREVDYRLPIVAMRSADQQLNNNPNSGRWVGHLLANLGLVFAIGCLLIALIGQYAVVAFATKRRSREFGVRIALGASKQRIVSSVVRDGLRLTALGLAAGFIVSFAVGRALRTVLYGIAPADPLTYSCVFAVLTVTSMIACYMPARRAASADAMRVLRQE